MLDLRINGSQSFASKTVDVTKFPEELQIFYDTISQLVAFTLKPERPSNDHIKNLESSIMEAKNIGLKTLRCLLSCSQRILYGISTDIKNIIDILNDVLPQLSDLRALILPCNLSIDAHLMKKQLEMFKILLLARYSLMESDIVQLSHSWAYSSVPPLNCAYTELLLLQSNVNRVESQVPVGNSSLENLNLSVACQTFTEDSFADAKNSLLLSDSFYDQLDLIPIQVKSLNDPDEAKALLRKYRERPSFTASSQFYILQSIVQAKTNEPVHTIK